MDFWDCHRIPSNPNFKLKSRPLLTDGLSLKLEVFICNEGWNIPKLKEWVSNDYVERVLSIPVSTGRRRDELTWAHCRDGAYSVKSGNRVASLLCSRG